jgi:hypothetical protein
VDQTTKVIFDQGTSHDAKPHHPHELYFLLFGSEGHTMTSAIFALILTAQPTRSEVILKDGWETFRTSTLASQVPTQGWQKATLPNIEFVPAPGPRTVIWYRRTLDVPASGRVFLQFDSAGKGATLFVDGVQVDRWFNNFSPREIEITQAVKGKKSVEIALRCADKGELYADGYIAPPGATDADRAGKLIWPVGGYTDSMGIVLPVRLRVRPDFHLTDSAFRIITSVKKGSISVTGLANGSMPGYKVNLSAKSKSGQVTNLGQAEVRADGTWSLNSAFKSPKLWTPESPHLYTLTADLTAPSGQVQDKAQIRFGFREVHIEGPNFYLNGIRRNLLATSTWPTTLPIEPKELRRRMLAVKATNANTFRPHIGPWQKEVREIADEIGLMLVEEGPMYTDGSGMYAYKDPRFWQNYKEVIAGLYQWSFNHPSVIMWSLGNEILFMGNQSRDPDLPKKQGDLARFAKQLDPTRPVTFEADIDPDGAYDVIGLHYPHELPAQHAYPVITDWLGTGKQTDAAGGMLGTTSTSFNWDRKKPLYIGEYLWVPFGDYSPGSVFYGPQAYSNKDKFNSSARHRAWYDQTVAYRRAGVTGLSPWTAFGFGIDTENPGGMAAQTEFYKPIAAFPRYRALRGFAGNKLELAYDVFNDSPLPRQMVLKLEVPGASTLSQPVRLNPGENDTLTFSLPLPKVTSKQVLRGKVILVEGMKVHDQRSLPLEVSPQTSQLKGSGGRTLVQIEKASDLMALSSRDPKTTSVVVAAGLLDPMKPAEAGSLPVVGASALDLTILKQFVAQGGRAVILEQRSLAPLGLPVQTVDHMSTMAFADLPDWPSLKFWGKDMIAARQQIQRSGKSGLRSLASTGGPQSLAQSPVSTLRFGQGHFTFVQMLAGSKMKEDPAALGTIQKALDFTAAQPIGRSGKVLFVGENDKLLQKLQALDLRVEKAGNAAQSGAVSGVVVAGGSAPSWVLERIRKEGLPVLWFVSDSSSYQALAPDLGHQMVNFVPGSHTNSWEGFDPLLTGVTAEELVWTTQPVGWDRQIQIIPNTASGIFSLPAPTGRATKIDSTKFSGRIIERGTDSVLIRRKSPVTAKTTISQGGWTPIDIEGESIKGAIVSLMINDVHQEHVIFNTGTTRTWVNLPKGEVSISFRVENAADWAEDAAAFSLKSITLLPPVKLPSDVRMLSGPGTIAAWKKGSSQVVAMTLKTELMDGNAVKTERLLGALCANLGMEFNVPETSGGESLPLELFKVESGPYNSSRSGMLEMRSNGSAVAEIFAAQAGTYSIEVQAESSPTAGVFSEFAVEIDGKEVGRAICTRGELTSYTLKGITLSAGKKQVRVRFTNDASGGGEDRNLFIRRIAFARN